MLRLNQSMMHLQVNIHIANKFSVRSVENLVNKAYPNSEEKSLVFWMHLLLASTRNLQRNTTKLKVRKLMARERIVFFERFERIWTITHDSQACGAQASSHTITYFTI